MSGWRQSNLTDAPARREHRAKSLTRVLNLNNRQFLSVALNTMLSDELKTSHFDRRPGRTPPHFPATTTAQRGGPGSCLEILPVSNHSEFCLVAWGAVPGWPGQVG